MNGGKIAKEDNSIQNFTNRIPEINELLSTNFKTMGDVLTWGADNYL